MTLSKSVIFGRPKTRPQTGITAIVFYSYGIPWLLVGGWGSWRIMSKRRSLSLIESLAVALAAGQSVPTWATANNVPISTAYRWSSTREFKILLDRRRRMLATRTLQAIADQRAAALVATTPPPA